MLIEPFLEELSVEVVDVWHKTLEVSVVVVQLTCQLNDCSSMENIPRIANAVQVTL